ncbi:hypothetical protein NHH03_07510, partial [Stieleria sp. TO1_6]|uniref:hypothetical protein n=1 Tax=Stieleria tagensis TaxID=2956795 RepID=UPI00209B3D59
IDIDYSDGDLVDINDNHQINSVVHNNSDRLLDYTATLGDISVNSITSGNAAVTLTAAAGAIAEAATNTSTNISTAGVLTLSAATGIGADGADQALDTNVGTLAAQTTLSGGIYINQTGDLLVGVGDHGVTGVTTNGGGDIALTSNGGNLQIDETVNSGDGDTSLSAANIDVNSIVRGSDIDINASGSLSVTTGNQIIAGGDGTELSIEAATITLASGSAAAATVQNAGTGTIELTSTSGNLNLADYVVDGGSGDVTIDSSGSIGETVSNDTISITTSGALSLTAGGAIGQTGGDGPLDVQVGTLSAQTTAPGGIFVNDSGDVTLDGIETSDGGIEISSDGAMTVLDAVTAGGTANISLDGSTVSLGADGDVTATNGSISVTAASSSGLFFDNDTLFRTDQGQVSGQLLNATNPFLGSASTSGALSDSNRDATIDIVLQDSQGENIVIQIDWQEGESTVPTPEPAPGDPRDQVVQSEIQDSTIVESFTHTYENAPDPSNPSADITVILSITEFAAGTINLFSGGQSLLDLGQFSSQSIVLEVSTPILPFFLPLPEIEQAAVAQRVGPAIINVPEPQRVYTIQAPQEFNNSIGTTQQANQRYYVLRIVTFGSEGEVKLMQDDQEYRLRDMEDPDSEAGFELSQLPELFKRLPDDRYRIYLIEGQTERLVLDFIIRDGQPIEAQSEDAVDVPADQQEVETGQPRQPIAPADQSAALDRPTPSVAERLGSVPVVSTGSVLLAAGMPRPSQKRRPGSSFLQRYNRPRPLSRKPA